MYITVISQAVMFLNFTVLRQVDWFYGHCSTERGVLVLCTWPYRETLFFMNITVIN
jgi:hypothetical protein